MIKLNQKSEGIIEEVTIQPFGKDKTRYCFTVDGKKYSTFKEEIVKDFTGCRGQKIEVEYYDNVKGEVTYHNIVKLTLKEDYINTPQATKVKEKKEETKEESSFWKTITVAVVGTLKEFADAVDLENFKSNQFVTASPFQILPMEFQSKPIKDDLKVSLLVAGIIYVKVKPK